MVMIGRLESGGSPTAAENADALIILNELLDSWTAEVGPIFAETTENLTWASGQSSRTIGTSGNLNTARPQQILEASVTISNVDYDLTLLTNQEYQAISNKTLTSALPQYLAYNPLFTSSLGTLYMWPIPSGSTTLLLTSTKPLAAVSALSTTVTLPPGYAEAIRYGLAQRFEAYFGVPPSSFISMMAAKTKKTLFISNLVQQSMQMDPMAPGQGPGGDDIRRYTIG